MRLSSTPAIVAATWADILPVFAAAPLESLTIRGRPHGGTFPAGLGANLVRCWGSTLRRLNVVDAHLDDDSLKAICEGVNHLEQLTVRIPQYMDRVMCPRSTHPFASC